MNAAQQIFAIWSKPANKKAAGAIGGRAFGQ
jgi:hypothetical protein